jgi:hypothetical protein
MIASSRPLGYAQDNLRWLLVPAMTDFHVAAGLGIVAAGTIFLAVRFFRRPKQAWFPHYGWVGLAVIAGAQLGLVLGNYWIRTFFTPTAWTGYLLLADAGVHQLSGHSRLADSPRDFFKLCAWSVPLWLLFEAYNLRLKNWKYTGLPHSFVLDLLGYGWSFATIWPAIFETADLIEALGFLRPPRKPKPAFQPRLVLTLSFLGLLMVATPLLVPAAQSRYLFGLVWVGFILLLDPLNGVMRGESLLRDWQNGERSRIASLCVSGVVCGFLWEFWNYWAGAKWNYTFPIAQSWKVFEMPLPGYLGFPAFALECFVMYEFVESIQRKLNPRLNERPAEVTK